MFLAVESPLAVSYHFSIFFSIFFPIDLSAHVDPLSHLYKMYYLSGVQLHRFATLSSPLDQISLSSLITPAYHACQKSIHCFF